MVQMNKKLLARFQDVFPANMFMQKLQILNPFFMTTSRNKLQPAV